MPSGWRRRTDPISADCQPTDETRAPVGSNKLTSSLLNGGGRTKEAGGGASASASVSL